MPLTGGLRGVPVFPPGTTDFSLNNSVLAPYGFTISPGYLEAAGTRLLNGRDVSWHDTAHTPYVAIVNETFAQKMWGDTPAIGQRFIILGHLTEVVGVAENGKYHEMQESPEPVVYLPLSQSDQWHMTFVMRSSRAPNEMAPELERTLSAMEPNAPITVQSWPECYSGDAFPGPGRDVAMGVMGLLAAMLAVTGIFGMAVYNVSRRMKELGIRVALGARTKHVMQHGSWAANRSTWRRIVAGSVIRRLCQTITWARCVSGKSAGSHGRTRRGANDGAAWHRSVRHSSTASAYRRSIQTLAGRVKQVNALHVSGVPGNMQVITRAFCCWRA